MATWLDGRTVVVAFICLAMLFSCSGAIILSLLATMYHDGLLCQAAAVGFAPKMEPAVCGWTRQEGPSLHSSSPGQMLSQYLLGIAGGSRLTAASASRDRGAAGTAC